MVLHYLNNIPFTLESADSEIVAFTGKTEAQGYGKSITLQELSDITEEYYPDFKTTITDDVSIESIKRLLAAGKPVIIPAAGRLLKNPYYSGEGPAYHMLTVTGYDGKFFYTNDSGTSYGERYPYPHALLVDAIHDWTGNDETILEGRKVMMTIDEM
jgi:uncharacterized protein YvpB